ncbi:LLM class flavin-dependent oxidoreductase [Microbacterium oleivorans]|uniref:LLM class flavin-dependent oxidoreductase n=1 Tax=Microbacterium oleivorans TaxID=273677 RepID=A0A4R5YMQ4_9MICO|nr:LLM class flavin-dependent oxidoreductase [Microbacterium oleivorans]TDL46359.1 LLM class flavin-dependent oxidoreductase [Microbacterium oleivorans]
MPIPLSILDLAPIAPGATASESIQASVSLAQHAEKHGYKRVWYAEHHNMPTIASSAPAVLIAHVAANTSTIRLGAGGVMLPNHVPLLVAEQFGTLEAMYPDRIDLGLGRAAGSDPQTMRALRRPHTSADTFPEDVRELQAFLSESSPIPGVRAIPGNGSHVPLYILGSSMYGAHLAAALGLPYAFASHFSPQLLPQAVATYRDEFQPSAQLDRPYVIAGINVIGAEDAAAAEVIIQENRRTLARGVAAKGNPSITNADLDRLLERGAIAQLDNMFSYTAAGNASDIAAYLTRFQDLANADELITVHQAPTLEQRLLSVALTSEWAEHARASA